MGFFNKLFKSGNTKSSKSINMFFNSSKHIRYENGNKVSEHPDCNRDVKIEPNITGQQGYTITVYNPDMPPHPMRKHNIQMAPKQMQIIEQSDEKVILKGFGQDNFGNSFSDYGLSIIYDNNAPVKLILHLLDRNVDIEYVK